MRKFLGCYVLLFSICLLISTASAAELPKEALQFRDDPSYFQHVRGIRNAKNVKATPNNIDKLVSNAELVYRHYLKELFMGFISEDNGELAKASQHYTKCLSIPVHEEQSYYTNIDLARISLKLGRIADAITYLQEYLRYMEQEIKAAEGQPTKIFFGHVPSKESLVFMKQEYKKLSIILEDLKQGLQVRYKPINGYVPDEETAINIAVAVWRPIFGKELIEGEKPYKAVLKDSIWYVSGSLPAGYVKGGVAEAEISKDDGRILRVIHGK